MLLNGAGTDKAKGMCALNPKVILFNLLVANDMWVFP